MHAIAKKSNNATFLNDLISTFIICFNNLLFQWSQTYFKIKDKFMYRYEKYKLLYGILFLFKNAVVGYIQNNWATLIKSMILMSYNCWFLTNSTTILLLYFYPLYHKCQAGQVMHRTVGIISSIYILDDMCMC